MLVVFLLTMLVVVIPTLHVMNTRYVQSIALFIGGAQMAYLALAGKIDNELSGFLVETFNNAIGFSFTQIIQKILMSLTV